MPRRCAAAAAAVGECATPAKQLHVRVAGDTTVDGTMADDTMVADTMADDTIADDTMQWLTIQPRHMRWHGGWWAMWYPWCYHLLAMNVNVGSHCDVSVTLQTLKEPRRTQPQYAQKLEKPCIVFVFIWFLLSLLFHDFLF
jgi:hypothetical protein